MFYVNNTYTDTSVSAHAHTLLQSLLFHREFYIKLICWKLPLWQDWYSGNCCANPNCSHFSVDKLAG